MRQRNRKDTGEFDGKRIGAEGLPQEDPNLSISASFLKPFLTL